MILVDKPLGKTPLEMVSALRNKQPALAQSKLGYAGRLDPMAHGLLLILENVENKNRKQFELMPKTYRFEVLFGLESDTYDTLGLIKLKQTPPLERLQVNLPNALSKFTGSWKQEYPPYSAARYRGKPLYWWARAGRLGEVTIPSKTVTIYELKFISWDEISLSDVIREAVRRTEIVSGDFRQNAISSLWKSYVDKKRNLPRLTLTVSCSSGTYVRSLAHALGTTLGTSAITYNIQRTQIGAYSLSDAVKNIPLG